MVESQLSSALSEKQALEDQVAKLRHELTVQSSEAEDSKSRLEALTNQYEEDRTRYQQTEASQIRLQSLHKENEGMKSPSPALTREVTYTVLHLAKPHKLGCSCLYSMKLKASKRNLHQISGK